MQSHGPKRTPEEFKDIRKAWKATKKKQEEAQRKAEEERPRQADPRGPVIAWEGISACGPMHSWPVQCPSRLCCRDCLWDSAPVSAS